MIKEPLTAESAGAWDAFVDVHDDRWLWDRSEWGRYQAAYGQSWGPGELIRSDAGDVVAILPQWPRNDLGSNLIVRLGSDGEMWSRLSKGHRSDVKRGQRLLGVVTTEGARFGEYQELHRAAFGVVRSDETFAIMREIVEGGRGFVMLATSTDPSAFGLPVGAALFFIYKRRAYYASAPRRPGTGGLPIGHVLLWTAMRKLARDGFTELDLGPPTEARPSIDSFKRHFGAELPPEVEGYAFSGLESRW